MGIALDEAVAVINGTIECCGILKQLSKQKAKTHKWWKEKICHTLQYHPKHFLHVSRGLWSLRKKQHKEIMSMEVKRVYYNDDGILISGYLIRRRFRKLLPLVNFWLLPSVFPADAEEIRHKCRFVAEVLAAMGLPVIEDEMVGRTERIMGGYREERKE